jgi:NADH:ubiquinone oxidoreductase subunit E
LKFLKIGYNNVEGKTPERRIKMSIPKEKWDKMFTILSEKDKAQLLDYAEYLSEKRKKALLQALKKVEEEDEELSRDEIEALKNAEGDDAEPIEKVAQELGLKWK